MFSKTRRSDAKVSVRTRKYMMYNYGYDYGLSPFHFVGTFIGWVIVFVIILFVIRLARGKGRCLHCGIRHGFGGDQAMDTLRDRYAKGEIDQKEFEERKKHLMS